MFKCLECNKDFKNDSGLHRHLRVHKMNLATYYQKHYPRYDKYDKMFIRFKSKEYYFNTDFNTKTNLRLWLESVSKDDARAYLRDYFAGRKKRKNLIYAPSQIELRSLPIPGMKYLNDLFGSYYQMCDSLGFKLRYTKTSFFLPPRSLYRNKILVDTREQLPLEFKLKTKIEGLKFGDYKLDNDEITCNCCIERKSLADFFGTMSAGFERFKKEMIRAKDAEFNLIVIIESNMENVYKFPFYPQVRGRVSTNIEFLFHNMREILHNHPNVQFLFVENRAEASRVIEKIFASNCEYKEIDLQYAYDTKTL